MIKPQKPYLDSNTTLVLYLMRIPLKIMLQM